MCKNLTCDNYSINHSSISGYCEDCEKQLIHIKDWNKKWEKEHEEDLS